MTAPYSLAGMRRAKAANDRLTRSLIDLAATGLRPHCSDAGSSEMWLSEHEGERAQAALMCQACPVIDPCYQVGTFQSFGVFGGRDFTKRQRKPAA